MMLQQQQQAQQANGVIGLDRQMLLCAVNTHFADLFDVLGPWCPAGQSITTAEGKHCLCVSH
jgi:hypothetical protein